MRRAVMWVTVLTLCLAASSLFAQEEKILLKSKAFADRQRPGVDFPHQTHFDKLDCLDCHHDYQVQDGKKENVWDPDSSKNSCSACHKVEGDGKVTGLMQAFHANCMGCHRKTLAEGKKTGSIMCGECHQRK